ncbi:hypothetical protein EZV61_17330 [Corallincola luteus]|uniref:Uncharacterized protein n=1 Tax=Corallincola luteus TaxID=1775177 RepID=A0ABY2AGP2_9GAMM|nr:hypothetical protein [Corallincola luteus]TCI01732.1 hypothetical protein EZV61_17330 [Corallincola luteus]
MSYIMFFGGESRWTSYGYKCVSESDVDLDFHVVKALWGNSFSLVDGSEIVADVSIETICSSVLSIEKVNIGKLYHGWVLNGSKEKMYSVNGRWELEVNGKVFGRISSGGTLFNSIFTLFKKGGWMKPRPYNRIDFDSDIISPRFAMCLLIAETLTSPV